MTTFSNANAVSDTITISSISSLANAAYSSPSTAIDNTPTNTRGMSYMRGSIRIGFSSALTAGSTSPFITVFRHRQLDNVNNPSPPAGSAVSPTLNAQQSVVQLVASTGFQYVDFGPFDMDPFNYTFQIYNVAGVAFSGTVTATLYRWNPIGA